MHEFQQVKVRVCLMEGNGYCADLECAFVSVVALVAKALVFIDECPLRTM